MKLSELTIRTKLATAFGLLALLVLAVSALAVMGLSHNQQRFSTYVEQTSARLSLANAVRAAAQARAIAARNLVLVDTPAARESEKAFVTRAHADVGEAFSQLKGRLAGDSDVTAEEHRRFEELESIEARYGPVALAIVDLALANHPREATVRMNDDCRPLLAALLTAAEGYLAASQTQATQQVADATDAFFTHRRLLVGASVVAVFVALGFLLLITRDLTRALGAEPAQLGAVARRVAQGDLGEVRGARQAPRASVLASLGEMQQALAAVVSQVRHASDSIATGSTEIASGNTDLSQRTEQQATSLQQTAASMEQMNAAVRHNADSAHQATQLATSASQAAARGGEVVGQVVATMEDISASSKKIADIIGVIDGIAFQTNILALNAAVEAARAGEQGRGFAVVAGEVRNLAQRSAEAAKEIKSLIGTSVDKVDAGTRLVGAAGTTMEDIVSQVRRVADLIGEISHSTIEQTSGIGLVSDAVSELDRVTQQNASLVEESAAAADSLKQQAAHLAEQVSIFRVAANAVVR